MTTTNTKDFIKSEIETFQAFIREQLPHWGDPTLSGCICTFLLYDRVVRGYFILWLTLTFKNAKTDIGKEISDSNLKCEIDENHPQLLIQVIVDTIIGPKNLRIPKLQQFYEQVDTASNTIGPALARITAHCCDPVNGPLVMSLLENGSLEFIGWMEQVADHRIGVKSGSLKYFEIHGEADKEHAVQFIDVFIAESNNFYRSEASLDVMQNTMVSIRKDVQTVFTSIFSFVQPQK